MNPLISIQCLVYNHEPYLRQCLDGIVMQKTNFPFEAIVHDDASTDGSAAIIREYAEKYPDIIKPIYETENQYSKHDGSIHRIMNAAMHPESKYVAYCEGDDYWNDPDKLQIQVDFLESHPDFVICSHDYICYYEDTHEFDKLSKWGKALGDNSGSDDIEVYTLKTYHKNWWTQPLTCVYRRGNYRDEMKGKGYTVIKDYNFYYYVLKHGKGALIKRLMGVYRQQTGGVWSSQQRSEQCRRGANFGFELYNIEGDRGALELTRTATFWLLGALKKEGKKNYLIPELKNYYKRAPFGNFLHLLFSLVYIKIIDSAVALIGKLRHRG